MLEMRAGKIGVYRVLRAGLEAWLGVHITFVSGLFVVVVASTGVLALVPWVFIWVEMFMPALKGTLDSTIKSTLLRG